MKSNDIYRIWMLLNDKIDTSKKFQSLIAPLIDLPHTKVYLGNNTTKEKKIYLDIEKENVSLFVAPDVEGLDFSFKEVNEISSGRIFLIIAMSSSLVLNEAFEGFSAALVSSIENAVSQEEIFEIINDVCKAFDDYFSHKKKRQIGDLKEIGLFGELLFLKNLVSRLGEREAIGCWYGPEANKHDYSLPGNKALEIKTTTQQKKRFIPISNELQLDSENTNGLWIKLYVIERNAAGMTLNSLFFEILSSLKEHDSVFIFKSKVYQYGFDFENDIRIKKFSTSEELLFKVDDGFPKITRKSLPNGVFDVGYKISRDGLGSVGKSKEEDVFCV